jgi:hypothetical protein
MLDGSISRTRSLTEYTEAKWLQKEWLLRWRVNLLSRHQQQSGCSPLLSQPAPQLQPVQVGHRHIAEDKVDRARELAGQQQCLFTVSG